MSHYTIRRKVDDLLVAGAVLGDRPRIGETVIVEGTGWVVVHAAHCVAPDACGVTCSNATVYVERDLSQDVP